jgi:hypothetical protein
LLRGNLLRTGLRNATQLTRTAGVEISERLLDKLVEPDCLGVLFDSLIEALRLEFLKPGLKMSDPYFAAVRLQWLNIRGVYITFESKKPIILYDIQEEKIFAYPYQEFKADMTKRNQEILERAYTSASNDRRMVVFVRDNENRKLVSYVLDIDVLDIDDA